MTFYDIVTLLVPGVLVCCAWNWTIFSHPDKIWWGTYIAQFGLILMIGLLLKSVNVLWSEWWFRNNTDILLITLNGETNLLKELSCDLICGPLLYIISPISGLIHRLYRNPDEGLLDLYYNKYNSAYYNEYSGKRIEMLESQVAFLQTWSWALAFCMVGKIGKMHSWGWCDNYEWGIDWWILAIGIYACIVAIFILQKKIYQVVWDNMDAPIAAQKERKTAPYGKERFLKGLFWISIGIVVVMLCVFIYGIGSKTVLSDNSEDYASFSTYIGAIGTMLFTAVYAYSFIQLQGAVNDSTRVQEESHRLDKEKGEEQKIMKSMIFALSSIENSVNACVEQMKGIKIPAKENNIPENDYTDLKKKLLYAEQNINIYNAYYQNKAKSIFPDTDLFAKLNEEMYANIELCMRDLEEWHQGKQTKTIRQIINANLLKTINIAKNIEVNLFSSLL